MQAALMRRAIGSWPKFFGLCAGLLLGATVQAATLNFSSSASVYGYLHTNYVSPYFGPISFDVNGTADYQYRGPGNPTPTASVTFDVAPNRAGGVDPVYDIVTSNGAYGFSYTGLARSDSTLLHAQITTSQVDASLSPVPSTPNTSVNAFASASWQQQFYIAPTAARPAGSYGAILVGITLDGGFPKNLDGSASAQLYAYSSFVDVAGVSYSSNFGVDAYSWDPTWSGQATVFKKLLFQYGTVFDLSTYLWTSANGNNQANFFNTGKISSIELPFASSLDSGASQAGLGGLNALFGVVFNSPTQDDQNTNWDFAKGGGGFTPRVPVPEPATWLTLAAGLVVLGLARRRTRR